MSTWKNSTFFIFSKMRKRLLALNRFDQFFLSIFIKLAQGSIRCDGTTPDEEISN